MSLFFKKNGIWKKIVSSDEDIISTTINKVYPVGAIYMSMSPASPQVLFGGEWEALNEGRVLIGANSTYAVGSKGGSKDAVVVSHNHTFSGSNANTGTESQYHSHKLGSMDFTGLINADEGINGNDGSCIKTGVFKSSYMSSNNDTAVGASQNSLVINFKASDGYNDKPTATENATHTHNYTPSGSISTNGVNGTDRNMQPYMAVYMWKRTG